MSDHEINITNACMRIQDELSDKEKGFIFSMRKLVKTNPEKKLTRGQRWLLFGIEKKHRTSMQRLLLQTDAFQK